MPNYVRNSVTFEADAETVAFVLDFIKGIRGSAIDFNSIIPSPVGLDDTTSRSGVERSKEGRMAMLRFGYPSWYEWRREHWGTKWNASDISPIENGVVFDTAWSAPHPILRRLAKCFPDVRITHRWADEDTGYNCGECVYHNGTTDETIPEGGSYEAYEIAFDLWPWRKDDYELVDGNYQMIDED